MMLLPSLLAPSPRWGVGVTVCDLRGCRALWLRSPILTRPTLGAPRRALFHWAMARRTVRRSVRTKSGTDQVCGAKQRTGMRLTVAEAEVTPPSPTPIPHHAFKTNSPPTLNAPHDPESRSQPFGHGSAVAPNRFQRPPYLSAKYSIEGPRLRWRACQATWDSA